jgi:flavorubredoxin
MMHFNGVVTLAIDDGMNGKFFHFKFEINFGATYNSYLTNYGQNVHLWTF